MVHTCWMYITSYWKWK